MNENNKALIKYFICSKGVFLRFYCLFYIVQNNNKVRCCLLYTSDAADDMQCVDLGGRRIIKKNHARSETEEAGAGVGFFQAEDGIRDVERSRGLGDVYKRQIFHLFERCFFKVLLFVLHSSK